MTIASTGSTVRESHREALQSPCSEDQGVISPPLLSAVGSVVSHKGRLEGIEVQRLKDKLGTRQMPTAELLLDGLPAHRVSGSPPTPHPGG
ncbi:unnamed protein product [Arctogadus glacialis]